MTENTTDPRRSTSEPAAAARTELQRRSTRAVVARMVVLSTVIVLGLVQPTLAGRVAILLSADVPDYQKAVDGFKKSTNHEVVGTYDMRGDFERGKKQISEIESDIKPDLLYVVGIWALRAVEEQKVTIPIVYSMVMNPPSIVDRKNVTGASMNVSVDETFKLLKQLNPNVKKVGTLYEAKSTGFLIEKAQAAAKALDIELVAIEVDSPRQAVGAMARLRRESVDFFWVVPDRHVIAPQVLEQILLFSYRWRIPVVGLSERHAEMGSLVSISFASSEDIGSQAGELATQVLAGKAVDALAFTTARKLEVIVNLKTAHKLGIEVSDGVIKLATKVIK